jgi:hypothetical protein
MARWSDVESAAPELAGAVHACFEAHVHKVLGTLRRDGSPRVSGTEAVFWDGDIWFGMMDGSMKALDLRRDPRFALHSATVDAEMKGGDAKLSGRAVEVRDDETKARFVGHRFGDEAAQAPPEQFYLFRADITEIVRTTVEGDLLVVESWHVATGLRRVERR